MSDLQCPATIILITPELAAVSDMRLALLVLAAPATGRDFGCETKTADIRDGQALRHYISELADSYRGEHVAIIARPQLICEALQLAAPPTAAITLAVDSDGFRVVSR